MKRFISLCLALSLVLLSLASCSSDSPVVLFFGVSAEAGSFDPQIVSDTTASIVVRNCYEGLLRKDDSGNIINAAAKSYEVSPDGKTYTFYLREDAKWHLTSNAKEQAGDKIPEDFDLSVTAADFEFALKRAADPATGSHMAYMLYNIENAPEIGEGNLSPDTLGVRAKDKFTLEIRLHTPQSNFPEILCENVAMPCNEAFFNSCSGRYGTLIKFTLSNGPFYLSRFDEKSYRINRAGDYNGYSPAFPDAVWLYVKDEEHIREELEENELSGAVLSESSCGKLKKTRDMTITEKSNIIRGLIMNPGDEILSDENIRKALAAATDVSLIAENAGKTKVMGIVPSSAASPSVTVHPELYDTEKAAEYLKAGLEELKKEKAEITVLCEKTHEELMRKLLQEWQKTLGMSLDFAVKTVSEGELYSAVESRNYQVVFSPLAGRTDSPYEYFGSFTSASPYNITGYDVPGLEKLLSVLYSGDEAVFVDNYNKIESLLYSACVFIPVWEEKTCFVCTENISGVQFFSGEDRLYFHNAKNK